MPRRIGPRRLVAGPKMDPQQGTLTQAALKGVQQRRGQSSQGEEISKQTRQQHWSCEAASHIVAQQRFEET